MKFVDPFKSPLRFVEYVRNSIGPVLATELVDHVCELLFLQLIRKDHSGSGVACRDEVFKLIAGVMPSAAGIDESSIGKGSVKSSPIASMTYHVEERIVSATLLTHEEEKIFLIRRIL